MVLLYGSNTNGNQRELVSQWWVHGGYQDPSTRSAGCDEVSGLPGGQVESAGRGQFQYGCPLLAELYDRLLLVAAGTDGADGEWLDLQQRDVSA